MYFNCPMCFQTMTNQRIWKARMPMMQVDAPTANPHLSPKDKETRLPPTPDVISNKRYAQVPKKCSLLLPSITKASMFHRICHMLRCKKTGRINRWNSYNLWIEGKYFAPHMYRDHVQEFFEYIIYSII